MTTVEATENGIAVWRITLFSAVAAEIEARKIKIAHPEWTVEISTN
jgi:hypothetical protein